MLLLLLSFFVVVVFVDTIFAHPSVRGYAKTVPSKSAVSGKDEKSRGGGVEGG